MCFVFWLRVVTILGNPFLDASYPQMLFILDFSKIQ